MREDGAGFEQSRSSLGVQSIFNPLKTKESTKQTGSANASYLSIPIFTTEERKSRLAKHHRDLVGDLDTVEETTMSD